MMYKRFFTIICFVAGVLFSLRAQELDSLTVLEKKPLEKNSSTFSWSANALVTSNYIWRGLYVGGPSVQLDATVSYAGVFANVWWNIGATDWTFNALNPEVDVTIGFSRWGFSVYYLHMYYFDRYANGEMSRYFDFNNHAKGGTTGEWRVAYTRPVYTNKRGWTTSVNGLCAFRTFGRDGYYDDATGELKRAYSTYIEVGVDQTFGQGWSLAARLGITPAKSMYTGYQGDFAVTLVGLKLNKSWELSAVSGRGVKGERLEARGEKKAGRLNAFAHVMLQPWQVNVDNVILPIKQASGQKLNISVGLAWSI
jgi:hypothetical protein